jgi:adenine-specific DNA-methyltransferase
VDLSGKKVFRDATVTNIIQVIKHGGSTDAVRIAKIDDENIISDAYEIAVSDLCKTANDNFFWDVARKGVLTFDEHKFVRLGDVCFISKGMVLNSDEHAKRGKFIKKDLISAGEDAIHCKHYTEAKHIERYKINQIFYLEWDTKRVPAKLSRPTFPELYENQKLLINKLGNLKATYDTNSIYCDQTIRVAVLWENLAGVENNSINNSVKRFSEKTRPEMEEISANYNEKFLLGILNSRLGTFLLNQIRGSGNIDINPEYLKQLPIPIIREHPCSSVLGAPCADVNGRLAQPDADSVGNSSPFVSFVSFVVKSVDTMLDLKQREASAEEPQTKTMLARRIKALDREIDKAVYKLYDLTDEEIKIVEGE